MQSHRSRTVNHYGAWSLVDSASTRGAVRDSDPTRCAVTDSDTTRGAVRDSDPTWGAVRDSDPTRVAVRDSESVTKRGTQPRCVRLSSSSRLKLGIVRTVM